MARDDWYGCHGPTADRLDERFGERFGDAPAPGVPRCPFALLRRPDRTRDRILALVRDYRAQVLPDDWREVFSAGVVRAIDYTIGESDAATADLMDRA